MLVRQRTVLVLRVGERLFRRIVAVLMTMIGVVRMHCGCGGQILMPGHMHAPCCPRYNQRANEQYQGKASEHGDRSTAEARFVQFSISAIDARFSQMSAFLELRVIG